MQESLVPCGDKAAAVVISKSLKAFGTPDNWEDLADDYLDELSQISPDLLEKIWVHARRSFKYFPKIVELLVPVEDIISARKFKLMRLEMILRQQYPD